MKISIIIPAYNEENNLLVNLPKIKNSFESNNFSNFEFIVCDNNSTDNSLRNFKPQTNESIVRSTYNRGYAGGCNLGAKHGYLSGSIPT